MSRKSSTTVKFVPWLALAAVGIVASQLPVLGRRPYPHPGSRTALPADSTEAQEFLDRKERWDVKTGADETARRIAVDDRSLAKAQPATVAQMSGFQRPPGLSLEGRTSFAERTAPVETTVYVLDADILRYKLEADDHDIHIVICDHGGDRTQTMIAEIPEPTDVVHGSPFWARIDRVRNDFVARLEPMSRFTRRRIHVRITGVGFFDFWHKQSGVATNAIELHPVLDIKYLD